MTVHEKECTELIQKEMMDGIMNHGLFATPHEGLAVIMEEVEEARISMTDVESAFDGLKHAVFHNTEGEALDFAESLKIYGLALMLEAMQVAAMAGKFKQTFGEKETEQEQ